MVIVCFMDVGHEHAEWIMGLYCNMKDHITLANLIILSVLLYINSYYIADSLKCQTVLLYQFSHIYRFMLILMRITFLVKLIFLEI